MDYARPRKDAMSAWAYPLPFYINYNVQILIIEHYNSLCYYVYKLISEQGCFV